MKVPRTKRKAPVGAGLSEVSLPVVELADEGVLVLLHPALPDADVRPVEALLCGYLFRLLHRGGVLKDVTIGALDQEHPGLPARSVVVP